MEPLGKGIATRWDVELKENWRSWLDKIPSMQFHNGWNVKITPPFGGAIVRFEVTTIDGGFVSIYLDVFERLGCYGEPYWEVYPYGDDVGRCPMEDTEMLLDMIQVSINKQKTESEYGHPSRTMPLR